MTEARKRWTGGTATCGGCDTTWTAPGAAHCAACHETFSSAGLFDKHRAARGEHGECLPPEQVTNGAGERVLFHRDGMWRGPEMDEATKLKRFGKTA